MPYKDPNKQKLSQHESYLRNKDIYKKKESKRRKNEESGITIL